MSGRCASLASRALLGVNGPDAAGFLERIVTCGVERMAEGDLAFGALLSPQGKVLFDFFLLRAGQGFVVDVAADRVEELARRLAFYRLRARVEIGPAAGGVVACWGEGACGLADPRLPAMGTRRYGTELPVADADESDWHAHRIGLGMPQGGLDLGWGEVFPHEALMDRFGGVDFAKGCYVGQEVVSRMQHRGTARSRFVKVEGEAALPPAGTPVMVGGREAGTMGSSAGTQGLALLRLDRVAEAAAAGIALCAGDVGIVASIPPWAGFDWPAA